MVWDFLKKLRSAADPGKQSVVLRRQVPIRFDEPVRSWLGGLPQMPDDVPWPCNPDGDPLHFLAQIACADLPNECWNRSGPREGWLLLFFNIHCEEEFDDDDVSVLRDVQVLHVVPLGPEREPPEDMRNVRHAMSDGRHYSDVVSRPSVPKLWRRWPVDLVVQDVPPQPDDGEEEGWRPAHVSAEDLYDAPGGNGYIRQFADIQPRPLTWRGVLYLVEGLESALKERPFVLLTAPSSEPGWLAARIEQEEKKVADHKANIARLIQSREHPDSMLIPVDPAKIDGLLGNEHEAVAKHQQNIADLATFSGSGEETALAREIGELGEAYARWRVDQLQVVASLRERVFREDLDAPLRDEDWAAVRTELGASPVAYWVPWSAWVLKTRRDLMDHVPKWVLEIAMCEDALDLYSRDATSRSAIPTELLEQLEPKLRNVQVPHRMGGPRDAIQGYAEASDGHLLFQLCSDNALGWMWGDIGALFVYIGRDDLAAGRLDQCHARIEGG
jgi:hypothetical protein